MDNLRITKVEITEDLNRSDTYGVYMVVENLTCCIMESAPSVIKKIVRRLSDDLYEKVKDDFIDKYVKGKSEELIDKAIREKLKLDIFGDSYEKKEK